MSARDNVGTQAKILQRLKINIHLSCHILQEKLIRISRTVKPTSSREQKRKRFDVSELHDPSAEVPSQTLSH